MAMLAGFCVSVISEAFIVALEEVYSPIVLLFLFTTKRSDPEIAMSAGP